MYENHDADFVEMWKTGFDIYVKQVESQFTMSLINSELHIAGYKKEHYRRIHPESKVVESKNKFCRKRKIILSLV